VPGHVFLRPAAALTVLSPRDYWCQGNPARWVALGAFVDVGARVCLRVAALREGLGAEVTVFVEILVV
jgi:hypothetical protein